MKKITGGIYLVVDPGQDEEYLFPRLQQAIDGGIDCIQIWDHWKPDSDRQASIQQIQALAAEQQIPVLINNNWEVLQQFNMDGIHLDQPDENLAEKVASIGHPFLIGVTCGNDLSTVRWAIDHQLDYISFCSMFPSKSASVCEIVSSETVQEAQRLSTMPIFVAGGISLENIELLKSTGMNGVAVISSVLDAENPKKIVEQYRAKMTINDRH
ncbi:MAG TPA: thiamine phosphate synthase [Sunxiuqinia sp.]|nr:thiamine phosphate synthase [Sunxiuqinia sp.]